MLTVIYAEFWQKPQVDADMQLIIKMWMLLCGMGDSSVTKPHKITNCYVAPYSIRINVAAL